MDDWTAAQWADECARMKQAMEALEAARLAGTPEEYLQVLAYEAGIGQLYKENKRETH